MTAFRRLALATTITTIGVVGVGGLVRATGSGQGCPAWPKCFGRWIPPFEYHAIIEYSHRAIVVVAVVLLSVTALVALLKHRRDRPLLIATLVALFMIFVQAGLGAIVVNTGLNPSLVTAHIGTAMALVGLLVWITVAASCRQRAEAGLMKGPVPRSVTTLATSSAAATFVLILIGAYVRGQGAGLAFKDWPLMDGGLIPSLGGHATTMFIHRAAALAVGVLLAVFIWKANHARPRDAAVRIFANIAGVLYVGQAVVGGVQVLTNLAAPPVVAHVVLSSLLWASLVAAAAVAQGLGARAAECRIDPAPPEHRHLSQSVRAYVALTKPRIIVLLVVTTVPTMLLAARGMPSAWLIAATVLGGTLAAGAANTINMYLDRDIDAVMARTSGRPLPAHQMSPARALAFGIALQAVSFFFMAATVNLPAALLTQSAVVFYVFVYTMGLKRSTPQNIVIGGAAGAVPVLVGWAAVTGRVGWPAVTLFAVIFFWTPAHFWALAMRYAEDYRAAGVPMLPVVAGPRSTQRQIVLYTVLTVAVTLVLLPVARMGTIYVLAAAGLGAWFLRHALRLWRTGTPAAAMGLFKTSIGYLALLFAALGVDAMIHIAA
ncbi:MAG: heme o synthase [Actinomycetota bacterium]